jgi:hypothetical protein
MRLLGLDFIEIAIGVGIEFWVPVRLPAFSAAISSGPRRFAVAFGDVQRYRLADVNPLVTGMAMAPTRLPAFSFAHATQPIERR